MLRSQSPVLRHHVSSCHPSRSTLTTRLASDILLFFSGSNTNTLLEKLIAPVEKRYKYSLYNRYYASGIKSLKYRIPVAWSDTKRTLSIGWCFHPMLKHFGLKEYFKSGKRPAHSSQFTSHMIFQLWMGFEFGTSCLACTLLTISPTQQLWLKKRYFSFKVTHEGSFTTG
jgi:hypothetical protein